MRVENWGWSGRILTPNELNHTFWVPNYHANFHRNQVGTATAGDVTDRQTHRKRNVIICPLFVVCCGPYAAENMST